MILIKQIRVIDPVQKLDQVMDLELKEGCISRMGAFAGKVQESAYERVLDGRGLTCAPGFMDVHVHFRDPGLTYKEDILTGAAAAAAGGFTRVVCMANTKPVVDEPETLRYVLEKGAQTGIHVMSCAAVTKGFDGKELVDMPAMKEAGAAGFTDDGIPILDEELVRTAMTQAKALQVPISLHEEDPGLISQNGINKGAVSEKLGIGGAPHEAEDRLVERDARLALETGCTTIIQHISSGVAVDLVRKAKAIGAPIAAEATPHHFSLTEDAVLTHGTLAKMNPPLRTEWDRQAIIEGLKDGTIDMIATDHAPHSKEEKEKALTEAPSGILGLETSFALGVTNLVRPGHLTLAELIAKMSVAPAVIYGLEAPRIAEGEPADLVLFSEEAWKVEKFASKSENSPFAGMSLYGKIKCTICGGAVVYENKE